MENITIDCGLFTGPEDLHDTFAQALSFPAHYGRNLDALHDCLTEISQEIKLRLLHCDQAEALLPRHTKRAILDAAAENPHLSVIFD